MSFIVHDLAQPDYVLTEVETREEADAICAEMTTAWDLQNGLPPLHASGEMPRFWVTEKTEQPPAGDSTPFEINS